MSFFTSMGNNGLNSTDLFYWRNLYKEFIASSANSMDLWYEEVLYGRVDQDNVAIYPEEGYLRQVRSNNTKTVFAVSFVAAAWEDFRDYVHKSVMGNELSKDSLYTQLIPQSGWQDVNDFYHEWNFNMYLMFLNNFMNLDRGNKVTNFKEFVNVYLEFVESTNKSFPQTREALMLSRWCSPRISGLIIEISDASHGDDKIKTEFLQDPGYNTIVKLARRFGFKIDKNAPWRFIADLESEKMIEYMNIYTLDNKEKVYNSLYHRTIEDEIEIFRHYMWSWYDEYTEISPTTAEAQVRRCDNSSVMITKYKQRLSRHEAFTTIPDSFWVRLYAYTRAKETGKTWKQAKFDKVVKKTLDLMALKGKNTGMSYLYKELEQEKNTDHLKNDFTKEEIDVILRERSLKGHKGTFKF